MNAADKLAAWVEKRPLILTRFDKSDSEKLLSSRDWPNRFTFARRHGEFDGVQVPTACIVEASGEPTCYLGIAGTKRAVTTIQSCISITRLRPINLPSLKSFGNIIPDRHSSTMLQHRLSKPQSLLTLSPQLSGLIIHKLGEDKHNREAIETVVGELEELHPANNIIWEQQDAIKMAMEAFGLESTTMATEVTVRRGIPSSLRLKGTHVLEDNVICKDSSTIPGYSRMEKDVTGKAVFEKNGERLEVYTANRGPLEKMLGVDLIYVDYARGSVVMVQYKMLEQEKHEDNDSDWIFRPDKQTRDEVSRMRIPKSKSNIDDYRLNANPFYFKFAKRELTSGEVLSPFILSLEHLEYLLETPRSKGPRGSIRLDYSSLQGTYLRESNFVDLIHSGYIGTHQAESKWLETIIAEVAKGNKGLVLAWQEKIKRDSKEL